MARMRPADIIKVHVGRCATAKTAEAAIAHLVEEWAALTYICMVEAAIAADAANEVMQPDEPAPDFPSAGGEAA